MCTSVQIYSDASANDPGSNEMVSVLGVVTGDWTQSAWPANDALGRSWLDPAYAPTADWSQSVCTQIAQPANLVNQFAVDLTRAAGTYCDDSGFGGPNISDWIKPNLDPVDMLVWHYRKVVTLPVGAMLSSASVQWAADNGAIMDIGGTVIQSAGGGGWGPPPAGPIDVLAAVQSALGGGNSFVVGFKALNTDNGSTMGLNYRLDISFCAPAGLGGGASDVQIKRLAPVAKTPTAAALAQTAALVVAPNPADKDAQAGVKLVQAGLLRLRVFDITGAVVMTADEGPQAAGLHRFPLGAGGLAKGLYLVVSELDSGAGFRPLATFKWAVTR